MKSKRRCGYGLRRREKNSTGHEPFPPAPDYRIGSNKGGTSTIMTRHAPRVRVYSHLLQSMVALAPLVTPTVIPYLTCLVARAFACTGRPSETRGRKSLKLQNANVAVAEV